MHTNRFWMPTPTSAHWWLSRFSSTQRFSPSLARKLLRPPSFFFFNFKKPFYFSYTYISQLASAVIVSFVRVTSTCANFTYQFRSCVVVFFILLLFFYSIIKKKKKTLKMRFLNLKVDLQPHQQRLFRQRRAHLLTDCNNNINLQKTRLQAPANDPAARQTRFFPLNHSLEDELERLFSNSLIINGAQDNRNKTCEYNVPNQNRALFWLFRILLLFFVLQIFCCGVFERRRRNWKYFVVFGHWVECLQKYGLWKIWLCCNKCLYMSLLDCGIEQF